MLLGAEQSELGADDLEELADDDDEYFRLGDVDEQFRDYAALALKGDHGNRRAPKKEEFYTACRVWDLLCDMQRWRSRAARAMGARSAGLVTCLRTRYLCRALCYTLLHATFAYGACLWVYTCSLCMRCAWACNCIMN